MINITKRRTSKINKNYINLGNNCRRKYQISLILLLPFKVKYNIFIMSLEYNMP